MRRLLFAASFLVVACDDPLYFGGNGNEIVFGIEQRGDVVSADYDFIGLDGHGGSIATAFRDGDGEGSCWFEKLDARLGHPHVDNGIATWTGGTLPRDGLLVQANQGAPTKAPAPGWTSADTLSFYAEGFAMPPLQRVTMRAPLVELAIGGVAPAPDATTNTVAITSATEVGVTWTPPADKTASSVLVTLETEHANVRCFNLASAGTSIVPARWIAKLFDSDAIGGHLTIASHRQTTMLADGGWTVYVVATAVHRDIAFTGTR